VALYEPIEESSAPMTTCEQTRVLTIDSTTLAAASRHAAIWPALVRWSWATVAALCVAVPCAAQAPPRWPVTQAGQNMAPPAAPVAQHPAPSGCLVCAGCGSPIRSAVPPVACRCGEGRTRWRAERPIPWEAFAQGEYVGPHRTPHVPEYRLRVGDQVEFVYRLTREASLQPYQLMVGDEIEVTTSGGDTELNQPSVIILSDGTISLRLIGRVVAAGKTIDQLQTELNERYQQYVKQPAIVVRGIKTDTQLQDLRDSVDARFGAGGLARTATVTPDGTLRLPMIGAVPAVGLTLDELAWEVNLRHQEHIRGIELTPILAQRAPRFIYVLGEVNQGGRIEIDAPTSVMQAIAMAGGWRQGANLREVIVLRRDDCWRLIATRLDLNQALHGRQPPNCDEIWLRDSDIVLVVKMPIQRLDEIIDMYVTRGAYAILPNQGFSINFDDDAVIIQ